VGPVFPAAKGYGEFADDLEAPGSGLYQSYLSFLFGVAIEHAIRINNSSCAQFLVPDQHFACVLAQNLPVLAHVGGTIETGIQPDNTSHETSEFFISPQHFRLFSFIRKLNLNHA